MRHTIVRTSVAFAGAMCIFFAFPAAAEETHTIHIKDGEYVPNHIEIEKDDTVVFINEDAELHWPASDVHPTHTSYPGSDIRSCETEAKKDIFDACRGLQTGEDFQFTFTEPGKWSFHDHLHPSMQGTITVAGIPSAPESARGERLSLVRKFSAFLTRFRFWLNPEAGQKQLTDLNVLETTKHDAELEYWMRVFGYRAMFEEIEKESREGGAHEDDSGANNTSGQCHTEGHFAGSMAYRLSGIGALYERELDTRCQYGFYHGIIESSLGAGATDATVRQFAKLCTSYENDPQRRLFCEHVIGHGLMVYYNYDLPYVLLKCNALLSTNRGRLMCYDGVFMENMFAALGLNVSGHTTRWINPDKSNFPCDAEEIADYPAAQGTCYFNLPAYWGRPLKQFDIETAVSNCDGVPATMRSTCIGGAGYYLAHSEASLSDEEIISHCAKLPDADEFQCLSGAAFMRGGVWNSEYGFKNPVLCPALKMPDLAACEKYLKDTWLPS